MTGAVVVDVVVSLLVQGLVFVTSAVVLVAVALLWSGRRLSRGEGVLFALSEVGRWTAGLLGLVG